MENKDMIIYDPVGELKKLAEEVEKMKEKENGKIPSNR